MRELIKTITRSLSDIAFPAVCACCGTAVINRQHMICIECMENRFESTSLEQADLLPETVAFYLSLWNFDKHGYLQALLHKLKYDHCTGIGHQLGREAGRKLKSSGLIENPGEWALLAVPLHSKRYRKRGYNQSFEIARGVAERTGITLIEDGIVTRVKNTRTQTGLNSSERGSNISGAFKVSGTISDSVKGILIIDDVFTTGATTFELAQTVAASASAICGILTVAKA